MVPNESVIENTGASANHSTETPKSSVDFRLKIWSNGTLRIRPIPGFPAKITSRFLAKYVPGLMTGAKNIISTRYADAGVTVYRGYGGRGSWSPTFPASLPRPHGIPKGSFRILTVSDFLEGLVPISIVNSFGLRWMPSSTKIVRCSLKDDNLRLGISQTPRVENIPEFEIEGTSSGILQINHAGACLEFTISDIFGRTRILRLYHDGYGPSRLTLKGSVGFERVAALSFDGVKLRIIAVAGKEFSAATLYKANPLALYHLGEMAAATGIHLVRGASRVWQIDKVGIRRQIEGEILRSMSTYAHGRLGAEIAYTIAFEKLGLTNVILREPSTGGKDLHTSDGRYVIQARLLTNPRPLSLHLRRTLGLQLGRLARKLRQDFEYNSNAVVGYAILSYLNPNTNVVKSIVLEVPKK